LSIVYVVGTTYRSVIL